MKQLLNLHGGIALLAALLILLLVMAIHPLLDLVMARLRPTVSKWGQATAHLLLDVIICLTVCVSMFFNTHRSPWGWFWFGVSVTIGILVLVDSRKHLHRLENS